MEEGCLFRVIDVYLSDKASPPLLQTNPFQEEEEEGLAFVVDESVQQQMRALGLPTGFSSVPRKAASRRQRRSHKSHHVTSSLDQQCSRKLCASIDQVWAVQLDSSSVPASEANYGEGGDTMATSRDHQESKAACVLISGDHVEASVLGGGPTDTLDAKVQADVSTIHELGTLRDSRGWLAQERARIPDGGGPIGEKEANWQGLVNMSDGRSLKVDCKSKVSPYKTYHCTEEPIIGSSRIHQAGSNFDELTSVVDYHGANNEEALLLSCGVIDGPSSCGMVGLEAINEMGSVSNSRQPLVKERATISNNGDLKKEAICKITATKDVSIAEASLVPTDGALVTKEPFAILDSRAAAHGEQVTTLSSSNQKVVDGGSIASCDARTKKVLAKGAVQELLIGDSHIQASQVLSWSACWDSHYGRYYFYNIETLESTWEPPKGFESYAYISALEVNNEAFLDGPVNGISNSEELVVEESKEERAPSEDGFKSDTLLHGPLESELEALPTVSSVKEALKSSGNHLESLQSNLAHGTDGSLPVKEVTIDGPEAVLESSVCQVITDRASKSSVAQVNAAISKVFEPTRRAKMAARWLVRLENQGVDISAAIGDHSPTVLKYWAQRFHLFSKYDLGVKLDEAGWFSVTPEAIAKHQAARCQRGVIVDAFTGVGGNAIQFALADHYVVAIDNDPRKIEYARHNAMIYGVADRIDFVLGDFFAVSSSMQADVVFLSPPWGGPDYLSVKVYDILTMLQPKDGLSLFRVAQTVASNVIFFLPRNVDINQLAELSKTLSSPCSCEVERNYLNGKLKAVTAYYGQFASMEETCS